MLLSEYLAQTQRLLQDPPAQASIYDPNDLTYYINQGRKVLAGESECARTVGSLRAQQSVGIFPFSAIVLTGTGYQNPMNVRQMSVQLGAGSTPMFSRPFPWFTQNALSQIVPNNGIPRWWTQQGQGSQGTIYIYPLPDWTRYLTLDVAAEPAALASDADTDVIPDLFAAAVPYYAAYLAYLSAQRPDDAQGMFRLYREHSSIGRTAANGYLLPHQGAQGVDPAASGHFPRPPGAAAGG